MKDFKALQDICINEVREAGITPGNITAWEVNYRAKTRWGMCVKKNGNFIIQIAAQLLEDDRVSEKACKDTMIHEILHTCKGCSGHTGLWLKYANIMNEKYGYDIKRTTSGKEKGVENYKPTKHLDYKYFYVCEKCGQQVRKKKACKFTRYYRDYTCLICGTKKAFRKVNR